MSAWLAAKNILALRMDNIGDVIMLGPALRAVKETSPQARLTLLASPGGGVGASLLPWVDALLTWRAVWQDVGGRISFDPARERELISLLSEHEFDAALIFTSFSQTPQSPGYLCYLAGIPLRAGETKEFGGSVLSTELRGAHDGMHQVERNLRLVESLGFTARNRQLVVALSAENRARAMILLRETGLDPALPYILVHPGASAAARRYPVERFATVIHLLRQQGYSVLVTGVEREAPLLADLQRLASDASYLVGQSSLPEYAALIEYAALVICNNTLPMHLADAVGTPIVALYSGTDLQEQWQPRTAPTRLLRQKTTCHPCYLFTCPIGLPCLDIAPQTVVDAAEELLQLDERGRMAETESQGVN
jgi:ADP-heptose:LPS heptosyltransferase